MLDYDLMNASGKRRLQLSKVEEIELRLTRVLDLIKREPSCFMIDIIFGNNLPEVRK